MARRLLLVDDEEAMRRTLEEVFRKENFTVFSCRTAEEAEDIFGREVVHVVLTDIRLPDRSGLELFRKLQELDPGVPCVLMTAFPQTREAVAAMKEGAHDYVVKPFELAHIKSIVAKASEYVRLTAEVGRLRRDRRGAEEFLGQAPATRQLLELVNRVAASAGTHVLIRGESGVGKELVAGLIHRRSPREGAPFVVLNCSAIPQELLEAELLGYEKGAYSGAAVAKKGLLEVADGGTLFLDEVADLPQTLQPKVLRVLDGSPFRRLGGLRNIDSDVRFVAATNRDLEEAVSAGRFRDDLLFRLKVFELRVPPLRERVEDIELLAEHFLRTLGAAVGKPEIRLAPESLCRLQAYRWPGNVRELKNVLERALILTDGDTVTPEALPPQMHLTPMDAAGDLRLSTAKKRHILSVLERVGRNRSEAARKLGISRSTLKMLLQRYGVSVPAAGEPEEPPEDEADEPPREDEGA